MSQGDEHYMPSVKIQDEKPIPELPRLHHNDFKNVAPFIAFDLEISNPLPDEDDKWSGKPFGISCIGTYIYPENTYVLWTTEQEDPTDPASLYGERMNPKAVHDFVGWLASYGDHNIVGWNSMGFDFRVLARECTSPTAIGMVQKIAMRHIDPAYQMLAEKGFMIGLEPSNKGMGGKGKAENVHGVDAPAMWTSGDPTQQRAVLHYVQIDAYITAETYAKTVAAREIRWLTRKGRIGNHPLKSVHRTDGYHRLMTVQEANELKLPEASWMDNPITRESCYVWATESLTPHESVV